MPTRNTEIPKYDLQEFRAVHRIQRDDVVGFGYNGLPVGRYIPGFELYSSSGLVGSIGPLRSAFYRISFTVTGTLDMQIGLVHYRHQPRTVACTYPNQIFSKNNISSDAFGYYLLFTPGFLDELLPAARLQQEFPFLNVSGIPLFQLSVTELSACIDCLKKMDLEVHGDQPGRDRAIQLHLYLLLLEIRRSYERQSIGVPSPMPAGHGLVARFQKLVGEHFLTRRQVADYAQLLSVSANHLNKVVKEITGATASDSIREMLAQEAKSLLRYTDSSISEIAYRLEFGDPSSFNRFFKAVTHETPLAYRTRMLSHPAPRE
jgi:AraC family transcriptional activator of pobA